MKESYGFTVNLGCTINNDEDYNFGLVFKDSQGNVFDKELKGKVADMEKDLISLILDYYKDVVLNDNGKVLDEEKRKDIAQPEKAQDFGAIDDAFAARMEDLEKRTSNLQEKVDKILSSNEKEQDCGEKVEHIPTFYERFRPLGEYEALVNSLFHL